MSDPLTTNFVLVGGYAGQTLNLGGHVFRDGVFAYGPDAEGIVPSEEERRLKADYLAKSFQAYPEGSPELDAAVARLEGNAELTEGLQVAKAEAEAPHQSTAVPAAEPAAPAAPAAPAEPAVPASTPAQNPSPPAAPAAPAAPAEPAAPAAPAPAAPAAPAAPSARAAKGAIRTALAKLDPKNDEHWTDAGLPSVAAVRELTGQEVARADITELAPKLTREEAAKVSTDPLD